MRNLVRFLVIATMVLGAGLPAGRAAAARPPGHPSCISGGAPYSTLSAVIRGSLVAPGFPTARVGGVSGNVNWRLDPYHHASWRLYLHSLRWVTPALRAWERTRRPAYLSHALAVTHDWVRDNPMRSLSPAASEATAMRSLVLLCLFREAPSLTWLRGALVAHSSRMARHYSGAWNHGLDENLSLFEIGCALRRDDLTRFAVRRFQQMAPLIIDGQGVTNEQSVWYAAYTHMRLTTIKNRLNACQHVFPSELAKRSGLMPRFLAHATLPNGTMSQLGDTYASPMPVPRRTTPTERTAIYRAGFAFGRTDWTPKATYYALRFGPRRQIHGHDDHMSMIWVSRGRLVLTDGGHFGYPSQRHPYRKYLIGPNAHNVLTVPGLPFQNVATSLVRQHIRADATFFELADRGAYPGVTRRRSLLFVNGPDVLVTFDRVTASARRTFTQLWHLPAGLTARRIGPSAVEARSASGQRVHFAQLALPGQGTASARVVRGGARPMQGWVSTNRLVRTPASVVTMSRSGSTSRQLTVIVPMSGREGLWYSLARVADGTYRLAIKIGTTRATIRISPGGSMSRG